MKYSIIIPTYNEEADIENTLTCLLNLKGNKEIIVVDDSTDNTPNIVRNFSSDQIKLIIPPIRKGRCEARNIGIDESTGDVVIILNADVLLPENYLSKLEVHFNNGFDSVTVLSAVQNMNESMYSRYVGLHHLRKKSRGIYELRKKTLNGIFWSEGFAVRRSLLADNIRFPSGFAVPIVAGEDVRFVDKLREAGCKGIIDDSVEIKHVAPSNFKEYWAIRKGRGEGTPQVRIFLDGWSVQKLFLAISLKAFIRFSKVILIVPGFVYVNELVNLSKKSYILEFLRMYFCWIIEQTAFTVGEFQSLYKIIIKGFSK